MNMLPTPMPLCGAFASEGLSLHEFDAGGQLITQDTHLFLKEYGTEPQRDAVTCRILATTVHLLLDQLDTAEGEVPGA
ncbi:hypothetical protein ACWD4N_46340 [Streptomyces sp. NPDC002586]